jgi:hypothetical protein
MIQFVVTTIGPGKPANSNLKDKREGHKREREAEREREKDEDKREERDKVRGRKNVSGREVWDASV